MKEHFQDLYERAMQRQIFCFTDFLSMDERGELLGMVKSGMINASFLRLFGGYEDAERAVARFGSPADFGWEEDFPICVLRIDPLNERFSEELTHRDYLGALMHLGIKRELVGDIRIAGNTAYLFVLERIAELISGELTKVKHTSVKVSPADDSASLPKQAWRELILNIPSERLDALVAEITGLSRGKAGALFQEKKVFVNALPVSDGGKRCAEGDVISIRGFGRFIYDGILKTTKKQRLAVKVLQAV